MIEGARIPRKRGIMTQHTDNGFTEEWKTDVNDKLEKFKKTLYGNGEPGMDEKIRNIESMLNTLIRLAWIVTGAVIAVAVSGVIGAGVYIIKNMP